MKILFIGDIVGKIGRRVVKDKIPFYVKKYGIDFVIANGENASHGKGLLKHHYLDLIDSGIDVVTLGNHYNSKNEINKYIDGQDRLVRPINLLNTFPGEGSVVFDVDGISIRITNLLGSAFMKEIVKAPYQAMIDLLSDENQEPTNIHIVDFHAEATAEKMGIALALDGKVSAVLCTHTHVQTKDARILNNGTAFISDVGMCGEYDSVLGFNKDSSVKRMIYGENNRLELDDNGAAVFSAIVIDVDEYTGKCKEIFSIYDVEKENENSNY